MAAKISIPSSVKKIFLLSFTSITVLTYLFLSALMVSAHEDQSHHGMGELAGQVISTQVVEDQFLLGLEIKNNGSDTLQLNHVSIDDKVIAELHNNLAAGEAIRLTKTNAIAMPVNYANSNFLSIGVDVEGQDRQYINLVMN